MSRDVSFKDLITVCKVEINEEEESEDCSQSGVVVSALDYEATLPIFTATLRALPRTLENSATKF